MNADGTEQVDLFLMDHGGQSALNQTDYGMSLWGEADGAMLVFDLTDVESLRSVAKWHRRLADSRPGQRLPVVLVGNKSDLTEDGRRSVSKEDAVGLAKQLGAEYFETSAAKNAGVDAPFNHMAKVLLKSSGAAAADS